MPTSRAPTLTVGAAALQAHYSTLLHLGGRQPTKPADASLAQRLGLVPGPPPALTPAQWVEVHLQSRLRQDSSGECSICLRPFKAEGQVLLSCSHTFHQQCLTSFERFSRQRCCPLCRCQAYQKRRIDDAEQHWRHTCAARIQAAWRGRAARLQFRQLRRLLPPQHPALKRRWCAEMLEESAARLVESVDQGSSDIDALFAELEATSAAAGAVYSALSLRCPAASAPAQSASSEAAGMSPTGNNSAAVAVAAGAGGMAAAQHLQETGRKAPAAAAAVQQLDWEAILSRCLDRDAQPECPICLAPLSQICTHNSSSEDGSARGRGSVDGSSSNGRRCAAAALGATPAITSSSLDAAVGGGLAVLSCSHAFHADCLSAFEAFAIASDLAPACPCCRSSYSRLDLR